MSTMYERECCHRTNVARTEPGYPPGERRGRGEGGRVGGWMDGWLSSAGNSGTDDKFCVCVRACVFFSPKEKNLR